MLSRKTKHSYLRILLSVLILSLTSSSRAQGPVSTTYHNVTARFNAYFYAKQTIIEVEQALNDNYDWNYNRILPIYPQYDTTFSAAQETSLEECLKKASKSIQYHPGSKWEYDSYILVGQARLYGSEFPEAIETFKYVNTKSDNRQERHRALVWLIRTFIEANEYQNAESAADYLAKEKLSSDISKRLYLNRAYLYQKRKDLDRTVQNLVLAEAEMAHGRERGRINFIIGQIYQQLHFDAAAYRYYRNTLKNSPEYELSFYTKLNMAQVSELKRNHDKKKISRYFRKLLKDPKNKEYQDKILYEMAAFEAKQGNLALAIENYKKSVAASTSNQRQRAYSYLKLSEIYYDSLKNYSQAKLYYDSTAQTIPKDEENYEQIVERQKILEEFVKHLNTIQVNDSLLTLAEQPLDEQKALLTAYLEEQQRLEAEKLEKQKKLAKRERSRLANNGDPQGTTITTSTEGVWYFYNTASVSRGRSEFLKTWGQRPLEDNWRRRNKASEGPQSSNPVLEEAIKLREKEKEDAEVSIEDKLQSLLGTIPSTDDEKYELLSQVEESYYQLGNIYNFQLNEKENAITTFEEMLIRFDTTNYKPEVLYQLFLLYRPMDSVKAYEKANVLFLNFPESVYSKLIFNPRYREENLAKNKKVQQAYALAYEQHLNGLYDYSIQTIDSTLQIFEKSDYHDNLELLRIINIGNKENIYQYQYELGNFIKKYPQSELGLYAQTLLEASQAYQINLFSSSKGKYVAYFQQKHYFLVIYQSDEEISQELPQIVENFISDSNMNLNFGNLVLDEKYSMVLVSDLPGKKSANTFLNLFQEGTALNQKFKGKSIYQLTITKDNFEILYESKDLRGYLNFYEKNYP